MVGLMIQSFPLLLAPAFFCNEDESTAGQQWGKPVGFSGSPWISGDLNMSRCMGPSSQVQQGTCVPSSFSKLQLWQFGPEWEEQKDTGQKRWPWSRGKETPTSKREKIKWLFILLLKTARGPMLQAKATGKHVDFPSYNDCAAPAFWSILKWGLKAIHLFSRKTGTDTFLPSELQPPTREDKVDDILQAALEQRG